MRAALLIFGIALWIGILYFMVAPWAAGACAALLAILGALVHNELQRPRRAPALSVHVHGSPDELARELRRLEKAGGIDVIGGSRRGPERVV